MFPNGEDNEDKLGVLGLLMRRNRCLKRLIADIQV